MTDLLTAAKQALEAIQATKSHEQITWNWILANVVPHMRKAVAAIEAAERAELDYEKAAMQQRIAELETWCNDLEVEIKDYAFRLENRLDQEYVERALHYPECWDTSAYPTLWDALSEVTMTFLCSNEDTHPALAQEKQEPGHYKDQLIDELNERQEKQEKQGPVAYVRYEVGMTPHFVPVINGNATFDCSAIDALKYEPLYAAIHPAPTIPYPLVQIRALAVNDRRNK